MRVYVASKWETRQLVRTVYAYLVAAGHTISHDWTLGDDDPFGFPTAAQAELDGVRAAEVVLVIAHPEGRGLYAELGAALALGRRVLVAGEGGCIFELHPRVERFPTTAAALRALGVGV